MQELHFLTSETVAEIAAAAFAEHERRIRRFLPKSEVRHTGGTSVKGVLTTGDVDLQVRTERHDFESARDALGELYEPLHRDAWHSDGAYFTAADADPPVEVALTVIGTLDDLHHGDAWREIADSPTLIAEYNAAKRDFFYSNFRL